MNRNKTNFNKILTTLFLVSMLLTAGCTDLDPVNERIDKVESEIESLQSEINRIKEAWQNSKVIADLQWIDADEEKEYPGGWLLNFNDGTSMQVAHGKDGKTPYVKIDSAGYWVVAYDGENYDYLLDENGEKISAIGIAGEDGEDGKDGKDGLCVRVVEDSEGYYAYEVYDPAYPDDAIETIRTPYKSDSSTAISAIVRDENSGRITLTMGDGSVYVFEMQKVVPSGIVLLTTKNIIFKKSGGQASFDIRVNPSNIFFNYNVASEDCQLKLEYVNRETSYNEEDSYPVVLSSIEPTKDKSGEKIEGQYTLILADSGNNIVAYKEEVFLTLGYEDPNGDYVTIASNVFVVEYEDSANKLLSTGLPIVMINTPKEITSKEDWMSDCTIRIFKGDEEPDIYTNVQMKGRGNSTWKYPKKPYAIKLDSKEEVLGMKKHKRWVLLANYIDRTLMRNAIAFEIAKMTGLDYTPSGEFVEVVMNGKHVGNYYLTEQIKVDKNRVNIAELDPAASSGEAVTGGYLMEVDKYYDEAFKFRSKYFDYPWMFKDPDEVTIAQVDYVYEYVNRMEEELLKIPLSNNYRNYLDSGSCIDYWFVNELMANNEINIPQSVYFAKDINGVFKMGPVWDFDWGTLRTAQPKKFICRSALYLDQLFQDPEFVEEVKERWEEFYPRFQTIPSFIEKEAALISKSQQINYEMWGCPEEPNKESSDFNAAVTVIKACFMAKLNYMDQEIRLL